MLRRARAYVALRKGRVLRCANCLNPSSLRYTPCVTFEPTIRQLAAAYLDLWEAQVAAVFSHNWADALGKTNDEQFADTDAPGTAADQPAYGDGDVDLDGVARRLAVCAKRIDAVDAEAGGRRGAPDGSATKR